MSTLKVSPKRVARTISGVLSSIGLLVGLVFLVDCFTGQQLAALVIGGVK